MKLGITLRSETGRADCATLDAESQGRSIYCRPVHIGDHPGPEGSTLIEGFTLTGGHWPGYWLDFYGGGIYLSRCSPTIRYCDFIGDSAVIGGGAFCDSASSPMFEYCNFSADSGQMGGGLHCSSSSPTVANCTFVGNGGAYGGGMACGDGSSPTLVGCSFSENWAYGGGGMHSTDGASPTLIDCTFRGNEAYVGGGVECYLASSPRFIGCSFFENVAHVGGGVYDISSSPTFTACTFTANLGITDAGGISCGHYSSPVLAGCLFSRNRASYMGGGAFFYGTSPSSITSCTFAENFAGTLGGCMRISNSHSILVGCVIANTSSGAAVSCDATASVASSCSDVFGNAWGDWVGCLAGQGGVDGNFSADPLFCNAAAGDFTLRSDSPCLPGQHPDGYDCGLIGAFGEGCAGPTAVEQTTWGGIKAMWR
jgi:hypothetical protein